MGAWNYMVFDDDTAYDVLNDLRETQTIITDMKKYFQEIIGMEYVGYDEGHYALVSAAVIDSVINDVDYRCDEEGYLEWTKSLKEFDFIQLKPIAVRAIEAVLSDNSELNELWSENKKLYESWRKDKLDIKDRLK